MGHLTKFSQITAEKVAHYVYALAKPDGHIFYVGKGRGDRVFAHEAATDFAVEQGHPLTEKLSALQELKQEGAVPTRLILRHGLTEAKALEYESLLIDVLRQQLTNIQAGHGSQFNTVEQLDMEYQALPLMHFRHPCILFRINKLWRPELLSDARAADLYYYTRASWKLSLHTARKCQLALSVAHGIIREVYQIEDWEPVNDRWAFRGRLADPEVRQYYFGKSVKHLFSRGAVNPFTYRFPE